MTIKELKTFEFKVENNPLDFLKKSNKPKEIVVRDAKTGKEYNVVDMHIKEVN